MKLPDKYKNVLYLYYYEEYTVPEIAELLDKKINTISTWLRRARIELKKRIEEE
jgi:RNA polymerase sigma-70 factor (ECF subfamily)